MTVQNSIPIVVGVTGHRNIRSGDRDALYRAVLSELSALKARCPHSEIVMLNSLAEGADTLCAEAANALSVPLIAAPFSFSAFTWASFRLTSSISTPALVRKAPRTVPSDPAP